MLLRRGGEVEKLESTGLPLGMMPPDMLALLGKGYEERQIKIGAGDLLALYSDGVTEAYDEGENEWCDERLLRCLRPAADAPSAEIVTRVFEEIARFAGAAPQHDDITLLVLKRTA